MLLVDHQIRSACMSRSGTYWDDPLIFPFSEAVQEGGVVSYGLTAAGYDARLGGVMYVFKNTHNLLVDPKSFRDEDYRRRVFDEVRPAGPSEALPEGSYVIPPHSYVLGVTMEKFSVPRTLKGRCVGKSTFARCGLIVNTTPLEPGWQGYLTVEIANTSPCPVLVFSGEGMAQVEFEKLDSYPEQDYKQKGGKYQDQPPVPVPAKVKN